MSSIDQQFIEYIVKSLVGKPDAVIVERRIDEKGVLLELTVDPEDLGRVIGKRGATAQSLRTLLRALGTKNDARYNLKIVDTGPPKERSSSPRDNEEPKNSGDSTPADKEARKEDSKIAEKVETEEPTADETSHSDVVSRTRAELADLDDLDV
jgi:uncharacterized protein